MATEVLPSELVNSVMAKLFNVLTNGDETVPQSEDNFFSWCTPGIPIEPEDLEFLSQGLTGVVKKKAIAELMAPELVGAGGGAAPAAPADGAAGSSVELTPALLEQLRAQDTARLYMQAENLARLVDFVPDVTQANNDQFARLNILNNEGTLSEIYRYVLRMSQVMQTDLPEETKKQIEEFRKLLVVTKTKKNLIDGSETQVTEPSELTQVYNDKLAAYENTALEYNSRRVDALTASDARAVHYWSMNANILRNRVRAAMSDWVSNGYKNDYEQISAFIDQVMQRDMSLLKQEYRDDLEKARLTGLASGSDFFYSSLIPGNFANAGGWSRFTFSSGDFQSQSSSNYSTSRWRASAGGGFLGIFGGGGGGGGSESRTESHHKFSADHFGLSFEIAQVPIVRPWFKQGFLLSKAWRFDQNNPESKDEIVSDGGTPARGLIPAYPTMAVFVRNLHLALGHSEGFSDFMSQHTSSQAGGGGYVSFGPFHVGGSYSRASASGSTERNRGNSWDNQGLHVPGMQVVGFKCHILPKSPNPLSSITNWI
jgi:hypothetical protein